MSTQKLPVSVILWQIYLWVIGAMFALGVHWVRLSIIGVEWIAGDAIIITLIWPVALGVDLVRLWEMFG